MFRITEIKIGLTFTKNLGNYEMEKRECTLSAQVEEGADLQDSMQRLQDLVNGQVKGMPVAIETKVPKAAAKAPRSKPVETVVDEDPLGLGEEAPKAETPTLETLHALASKVVQKGLVTEVKKAIAGHQAENGEGKMATVDPEKYSLLADELNALLATKKK